VTSHVTSAAGRRQFDTNSHDPERCYSGLLREKVDLQRHDLGSNVGDFVGAHSMELF